MGLWAFLLIVPNPRDKVRFKEEVSGLHNHYYGVMGYST